MINLVEIVARVLCERHIRNVRRHDTSPEQIEEMLPAAVDYSWREFTGDAQASIDAVHAHYVALAADEQVLEAALKDGELGPVAAKRAFLAMFAKMKEIST